MNFLALFSDGCSDEPPPPVEVEVDHPCGEDLEVYGVDAEPLPGEPEDPVVDLEVDNPRGPSLTYTAHLHVPFLEIALYQRLLDLDGNVVLDAEMSTWLALGGWEAPECVGQFEGRLPVPELDLFCDMEGAELVLELTVTPVASDEEPVIALVPGVIRLDESYVAYYCP